MERPERPAPPLSEFVEHVVTKRKANLEYLKRILQGKSLWLNTIQLSKEDIVSFYGPEKLQKRAHRYMILGLSVAALLGLPSGAHIVQAISQLMEEFEHFIGHPPSVAKVLLGANNGFKLKPAEFEPNEAFKPAIQKVNKQLWYQYLQTPSICARGHLDFIEVVLSLCDCLSILYSKFLDESCSTPAWQSMVLKIDKRIKAFFFAPLCKDFNAAVRPLMERQINGLLDPILPIPHSTLDPRMAETPAPRTSASNSEGSRSAETVLLDSTNPNDANSNVAQNDNVDMTVANSANDLSREAALLLPTDPLEEEDPFASIPCADGVLSDSDPFASPISTAP